MEQTTNILWRRLVSPGHDCCTIVRSDSGCRLSGMAVFRDGRRACRLRYEVVADASFQTRSALVEGFVGKTPVQLRIRRSGLKWTLGGTEVPALAGLLDLDLGFTPATNFLAIRRLALSVGQASQAPAAYLAFPRLRMSVIQQRYKRLSRREYEYEAPQFGYKGVLVVSALGVVVRYPGLFEEESAALRRLVTPHA